MASRERWSLGLLAAFWVALYLPHLLTGDTLPARDIAATQLPWRTVWREQVLSGSPPLWDPYSNGGRPLLANPNTMAAYPGTLLFLVLPPEAAAAWQIAFHHLLLILGCYRLARRTGATPVEHEAAIRFLPRTGPLARTCGRDAEHRESSRMGRTLHS